MKLSQHFHLEEFLFSETAARMGREVEVADARIVEHLQFLCTEILEPLRAACDDRAVFISSGYRPRWLNRAIGGSDTSEHMDGRAADIKVAGVTPFFVCKVAEAKGLPFNQCIHEFGRWTHISTPIPGRAPKRELLTARKENGRTAYVPGIVTIDTSPKLRYVA